MKNKIETDVILKTFLKTSCVIVLAICFVATCFSCLFPRQTLEFYDGMKMENPVVFGYERLYQKNESYEDLYNLVCVCSKYNKFDKLEKYTTLFLEDVSDKKLEFVNKLDASVKETSAPNSYAYVASAENYFLNRAVVAQFKNGKIEKAEETMLSCLVGKYQNKPLVFAGGAYLDLLKTLNDEKKQEKFNALYNAVFNNGTIFEIIDDKTDVIDAEIETKINVNFDKNERFDKMALISTKIDVLTFKKDFANGVMCDINSATNMALQGIVDACNNEIVLLRNEYNNLLKLFNI